MRLPTNLFCAVLSVSVFGSLLTGTERDNERLPLFEDLEKAPEIAKAIEKFSRREGYKIAEQLKKNLEWVDLRAVVEGMHEYISGEEERVVMEISEEENDSFAIVIQLFEAEARKNFQQALCFLDHLKASPSVHIREEGKLLYEILQEGEGSALVQKGSSPVLQYRISTLDGVDVATTPKGRAPSPIPLSETIVGFARGVEGMRVGERRKLYIHPDLGYAMIGHGVPPNSLLIADVEVIALG